MNKNIDDTINQVKYLHVLFVGVAYLQHRFEHWLKELLIDNDLYNLFNVSFALFERF